VPYGDSGYLGPFLADRRLGNAKHPCHLNWTKALLKEREDLLLLLAEKRRQYGPDVPRAHRGADGLLHYKVVRTSLLGVVAQLAGQVAALRCIHTRALAEVTQEMKVTALAIPAFGLARAERHFPTQVDKRFLHQILLQV